MISTSPFLLRQSSPSGIRASRLIYTLANRPHRQRDRQVPFSAVQPHTGNHNPLFDLSQRPSPKTKNPISISSTPLNQPSGREHPCHLLQQVNLGTSRRHRNVV